MSVDQLSNLRTIAERRYGDTAACLPYLWHSITVAHGILERDGSAPEYEMVLSDVLRLAEIGFRAMAADFSVAMPDGTCPRCGGPAEDTPGGATCKRWKCLVYMCPGVEQ